MGKIIAIAKSAQKGTKKTAVTQARLIVEHGIEGDAHAGRWHRQVSLLAAQAIAEFQAQHLPVQYGDFGENLVLDGFDVVNLPVGTRLQIGKAILEVTQIGKECHTHCAIFQQVGACIMPHEGVFARVLHGDVIHVGDEVSLMQGKLPLEAAVITASDKASRGEREDLAGPKAQELLEAAGYHVVEVKVLPDEQDRLAAAMRAYGDEGVSLVMTTGGTGFSPRDVTPEALLSVMDREAQGIAEAMRQQSLAITPRAMLSRARAGIYKRTLLVNLPGSPKAVAECLHFILPTLQHGLRILLGDDGECARS